MTIEFQPWPKTTRLYRDIVVTEKIDGMNNGIHIEPLGDIRDVELHTALIFAHHQEKWYAVGAQSRTRLLTLLSDSYGFARWVYENAEYLIEDLGPGLHMGEWWGQKLRRGYGLDHRRFSLFNTGKWAGTSFLTPNLDVVPIIYDGVFDDWEIRACAHQLESRGSIAAPGFKDPEGICVYHTASRIVQKYTFHGDGHKG